MVARRFIFSSFRRLENPAICGATMNDFSSISPPPTGSIADDIAAIQRIAVIPSILEVVCQVTGMGVSMIARVTEEKWIACAVRDQIAYGAPVGTEVDLSTALSSDVRAHRRPFLIENVAEDPIYRDHPAPRIHRFQSCISVPIICGNDDFFGTITVIDPAPTRLSNSDSIVSLNLLARLIALELDAGKRVGG